MKWIVIVFFAFFPFIGYALEIGPLVHEINTGSQGSRAKVLLSNNSTSPLFIDANVAQLIFEGADYNFDSKSANDLLVFPPAFRLDPGAKQAVIVIWSGQVVLSKSRSYSVKFTAISDSEIAGKDVIGLEINYNVIVHVSSEQMFANISKKPISLKRKEDGLYFEVKNKGSKYSKLSEFDMLVENTHTNQSYRLSSKIIVAEGLDTFIPASETVDILIPFRILPTLDIDQVRLVDRVH